MIKLPKQIKWLVVIVITLMTLGTIGDTYTSCTNLYNQSTALKLENDALCQKQKTNYEGYYNTFVDKQANANINKEVFIEVTNIIMSNRKDGQQLSWKWVSENQNIPYEEFTVFYRELSSFISERYADNMAIEQQKQDIVRKHNLLISIYPNNLYNRFFLGIDKLTYKEGYTKK